jgi:hypothetical protein
LATFDPTAPPAPLTARERTIFWCVAAVCALSRFASMARSLWDWDEALFMLGMRSYDVTQHHPHPPGFPAYIGLGRLVRVVIHDDFRALQAINLAAGILLFPALFMLARELRLRVPTAIVAGVLCAFFPNVWFFGGTAFSDVASIVLVVFAAAFLLRGCRDAKAYFAGALLLAIAAGIRPQNLMIGLAPALIATWHRARVAWRDVVFAALIGIVVTGVAFGGAIAATGSFDSYMSAVRAHGDYISRVDSFRSPERPPLWRLFDRFFIKQYDCTPLGIVISLFVAVSIVGAIRGRDRRMLVNFLIFGPFAISAWLMLDRFSISRFAIGYIPMFAIFAADGIARIARETPAFCKLSGLVTEAGAGWTVDTLRRYVDHLLDCFGPSRTMWGSDWPVVNLAGGYGRWREAALSLLWGLAPADRDAVLGTTAAAFYGL